VRALERLYLSRWTGWASATIRRVTDAKAQTGARTNRVGRHLPTSGGLEKTLQLAREQGLEAVQIFVSNPQGWAWPKPRPDGKAFARGARKIGLSPVVVHAKYLINLASPDPEHWERSARTLAAELVGAGSLGADLVVVHSGSHAGSGEEKGATRLVEGLAWARKLVGRGAAEPVIENSVGAGTQLCSTFDALAGVAKEAGVRVCVDTAHAYVAGYDFSTPEGARKVAAELQATLGERIALLHLNDPRNGLRSHQDGHERIGEGQVPVGVWAELFAALPGVPMVMETPYAAPESDAEQVRLVKELAGGLSL
jgi:deoxyribonuclease IV